MAMNTFSSVIQSVLASQLSMPGQSQISAILESTTDAITAHAGGTQAAAVPLVSKSNNVTVVASAGDSVALPPAIAGQVIVVRNATATSMNVYPVNAGTDKINALSANAAFAQAQGTTTFRCYTTGTWITS